MAGFPGSALLFEGWWVGGGGGGGGVGEVEGR